ncbi:unnamed protein product [Spirodela intermedia]|uniref:Germin-like protein n=1 Tax=Spirodela intermedia TaxID=51605 RepID=A0A7I8IJD5_SPIIN|nr:unnamed protein product [Spirodela intermedia]CAA6657999.1 unnamed protein product [Spirodela intermedia]
MASYVFALVVLVLASTQAFATDPSQLQDFCVADNTTNGTCRVVLTIEARFYPYCVLLIIWVGCSVRKWCGLQEPGPCQGRRLLLLWPRQAGNTKNALGSKVTAVNVNNLFGLNTLGISLARVDFAPYGLNPPHTHPRATEVLTLLQGRLYVGFVTSNPPKLFTKTLNKGDVFVFPQGLIHFQLNIGRENAVAIAALSSQNPGVITVANTVFGSNPAINDDVLAKAFQVDKKVVDHLQSLFWTENH